MPISRAAVGIIPFKQAGMPSGWKHLISWFSQLQVRITMNRRCDKTLQEEQFCYFCVLFFVLLHIHDHLPPSPKPDVTSLRSSAQTILSPRHYTYSVQSPHPPRLFTCWQTAQRITGVPLILSVFLEQRTACVLLFLLELVDEGCWY